VTDPGQASYERDGARRQADDPQRPLLDRWPIMGVRVTVSDFAGVVAALARMVHERRPGYVSCANAYSLGLADEDPAFRDLLNAADIVSADGVPVVWALRLFDQAAERAHNDDLVLACCREFSQWRHFLVGGRVGQAESAAAALRQRFPGIQIVGCEATPVRPVPAERTDTIVERIERSRADVVWAALGTPHQDYWMASVTSRLSVPLVGCGSLFDLLAGRTRAAPEWVKRSGLQWLFRLLQEPRRLAYRYARYNTKFAFCVARQYWNSRR
jgi:N-acetylglucosaminyldiphosphoundecaprenol N-acetyl-beta-D-mannosaminyltransferase